MRRNTIKSATGYRLGDNDALTGGTGRNPYRAFDLRWDQYKRGQRAALSTIRRISHWSQVYDCQS